MFGFALLHIQQFLEGFVSKLVRMSYSCVCDVVTRWFMLLYKHVADTNSGAGK